MEMSLNIFYVFLPAKLMPEPLNVNPKVNHL